MHNHTPRTFVPVQSALPSSPDDARQAVRRAHAALELMGEASPLERYRTLAVRERAHDYLGERDAQEGDLLELRRLADELGDPSLRADAAWRRSDWLFRLGRYDEGVRAAEAGLTASAQAERPDLRVSCLRPGAACLACTGRLDEASLWAEEASRVAGDIGDVAGQAAALTHLGAIAILRGRPDMAGTTLEAAVSAWRTVSDHRQLTRALNNLALAYHLQGWHGRANGAISEALELAEQIGDQGLVANVLATLGQVELALGMPHRALGRFSASSARAGAARDPRIAGAAAVLEGRALLALDEPAKAIPLLERASRELATIGARDLLAGATNTLADALLVSGRDADAAAALAAWPSDGPSDPRTLLRRAETDIAGGRTEMARAGLADLAAMLRGKWMVPWGEPDPVLWWRAARAARSTGESDLASELTDRGDQEARAQSLELDAAAREPFLLALHRRRSRLIAPGTHRSAMKRRAG